MNRRKQLALLAFAALVVLGENAIFFSSQPEYSTGVEGDDEDEEFSEEAEEGADELEPLEAVSEVAIDEWLAEFATRARNPFLTLAEAGEDPGVAPTAAPRLVGTLTSKGRRVAWLDSAARAEGEWIGEHEVRRIENDRVVLVRGTEELQLWLPPPGDAAGAAEPTDGWDGDEGNEREDDADE